MDPEKLFLDQFRPGGEAETIWLKDIFSFITQQICPLLSGATSPAADGLSLGGSVCSHHLSVCLVKKIQENVCVTHTLPVSYRLVSVSELLSQQHLPCVSNLCWSTNQQRAWEKEAELSLSGHQALPRVSLLLIGYLREGRRGEWRLTDASGGVRCECLSPSPLWLNLPVLLAHWNYIPHSAPGQDQDEAGGHVEMIGCPIPLCPAPQQGLAAGPERGAGFNRAIGVREAAGFLHSRSRGLRVSVFGLVGSVCPLLVVGRTTFFCFSLTDDAYKIPVLVKESGRLWWSQCVCVGQHVCVTSLRVCVLQSWRGNNILCVTDHSEIHTHADSQLDTPPQPTLSHMNEDECGGAEPERDAVRSAVRIKQSTVINYQGTVTEVVSAGAGLYVIDRKVGLCLAYQPALRRKLRAGDQVQINHVHFLYRPCPNFPPSMLFTCLRSSLRVTAFSKVGGSPPDHSCPGDGVLPRLLLEKNMGASEYLWACHLSSQLTCSLLPSVLKQQQCVCVLSWKVNEHLLRRGRGRREKRDIYSEMLDEPHTCPLTQYSVDPKVCQYISISDLHQYLQSDCWSSLSLSSLLPPGGSSLTRSQINNMLSWSFKALSSDPQDNVQTGASPRRRPLLLVGVLELPSQASEHALQLRDGTGALACVVTETSEGGQRAAFNTAWLGCLVCVQQFTMVTEKFIQSDFPSYQHLDQNKYITHKHCRIYLQFSLDRVHILCPSVAMEMHTLQKGQEPHDEVTGRKQEVQEEEPEGGLTADRKRRRQEEETDSSHSGSFITMATGPVGGRPCMSMVIRVDRKEGVSWRNTSTQLEEGEAGLMLCFTVRATVIGRGVMWGQDPKNRPMTNSETENEDDGKKVVLVFSGVSARWFPLLQPGSFYRLVAANTQDPCVFIGCGVSAQTGAELHTDSTLHVRPDWRLHTLTRLFLLPIYRQTRSATVLSVSDVLDCRSDLVCFQALVTDRISVNNRTSKSGETNTGVRLTVCDQTGRSLQVYLDLSQAPYPPGLLPGNTLLLSAFQRMLSRTGSVYCRYLPVSSITVVSLADTRSARPPPAPMMQLGWWALNMEQRCSVGQVKGHVVCFLFLQLQWSCSLCGSLYIQSCSSSQCGSTSSLFQSKAKLVLDDGTGEAHVWFSGARVRPLLGLADSQWEGLQSALRVRGQLEVYPRRRSLVCESGDRLLHFLSCLCSGHVACRQLSLTCRRHSSHRSEEMKKFSRGDRDFVTRMTPPLQLTCVDVHAD